MINPNVTINNTCEIYTLLKSYGLAPYNNLWAYENRVDTDEELKNLSDPEKPDNIIYLKRTKLYSKINTILLRSVEDLQREIDDANEQSEIIITITSKTQNTLAKKACQFINPIALEFTDKLTWMPTQQIELSKVYPIKLTDERFIEPNKYQDLKEFHDPEKNRQNMELILRQRFYPYLKEILPKPLQNFLELSGSSHHWEI